MTPNLLDELEGVVRLMDVANAADIFDTFDAVDDFQAAAVNFLRAHAPALADMAKRMEAAERDAARYRWLVDPVSREPSTHIQDMWANCKSGYPTKDEWDAAIDATQEGAG